MSSASLIQSTLLKFFHSNQLSGYDALTSHALLCIVVDMTSLHIVHVSNYTVVDVMTVGNENLNSVLANLLVTSECDRKVLIA
jgi:hypothetical protein